MPSTSQLRIEIGGVRVGVISRLAGDDHLFVLDEQYVRSPLRPTMSLSMSGSFGVVDRARPVRRRLQPFFSNLLPEGHLRGYLAAKLGVNPGREFPLLAALGADLPGAVVATPSDDGTPDSELTPVPDSPERSPHTAGGCHARVLA